MNEQVLEVDAGVAQKVLGDDVQAGVGRVAKFANGATRDWSLFLFFRIPPPSAAAIQNTGGRSSFKDFTPARLLNPRLFELVEPQDNLAGRFEDAGIAEARTAETGSAGGAPNRFAQLLGTMTGAGDASAVHWTSEIIAALRGKDDATRHVASVAPGSEGNGSGNPFHDAGSLKQFLTMLGESGFNRSAIDALREQYFTYAGLRGEGDGASIAALREFLANLFDPGDLQSFLGGGEADRSSRGQASLAGGLPLTLLFGLARLLAPGIAGDALPAIRSEREETTKRGDERHLGLTPSTMAFTHAGLAAMGVHKATLASFPAAFRQGMAARAQMLGDTGASSPSRWYGDLGLKSVHGMIQTSFDIGGVDKAEAVGLMQILRKDVAAFNERAGDQGTMLRILVSALCLPLGFEVVHVELGENPGDPSGDGDEPAYRREHFGFRDGLSQPFVDLGLDPPPPGGGTPGRSGTWASVAPGEIFLGDRDEDQGAHAEPGNAQLRDGATYFVFRKLAQDVAGFHAFLEKKRSESEAARERLAAQMFGRWKNGTSLVHAPDVPMHPEDEQGINDFRYARDDPQGRRCPLGAHVRRTNPRDIGGNNDVRRHRILRRSISYGGALLPPGSRGDGVERGMLFIAANARIEQQFELIQSRWINGGEFLGQAGLGKCPVTGTNSGTASDGFHEAGATAPVTGLPPFVTLRGGDYFFVPGVRALRQLAAGETFPPELGNTIDEGRSFGDYETLGLLHDKRLRRLVGDMFARPPAAGKVELTLPGGEHFNIVRRHADVKCLFGMDPEGTDPATITVRHYAETGRRLTGGQHIVIGTQLKTSSQDERERMHGTLNAAWNAMKGSSPVGRIGALARAHCEAALRDFAPTRGIDVVQDLMTPAVYGFVSRVLGVPGPDRLTEIAMALPLGKQFVGQVHPDWLATLSSKGVANKGLATLQVWSVLLLSDLIGNRYNTVLLKGLAQQAASEMLLHIDRLIVQAGKAPTHEPATLLDAFITVMKTRLPYYQDAGNPKSPEELTMSYFSDVRAILLELAGTSMATIPHTFGHVMQTFFDRGIDLAAIVKCLRMVETDRGKFEAAVHQIIYEAERLNPGSQVTLRYCAEDTELPSGDRLGKGEWVALLTEAANFDPSAFDLPASFSIPALGIGSPHRPLENYLMFGAGKDRICWGRDKAALVILREVFLACARLQALRPVAGPDGEVQRLLLPVVGLKARFDALV